MNRESKIYSFIGLLQKGGIIKSGSIQCELSIKKREAHLVLLAEDASQYTKEFFIDLCQRHKINWVVFGEKTKLGKAIGKNVRAVIAVLEKEPSKKLQSMVMG